MKATEIKSIDWLKKQVYLCRMMAISRCSRLPTVMKTSTGVPTEQTQAVHVELNTSEKIKPRSGMLVCCTCVVGARVLYSSAVGRQHEFSQQRRAVDIEHI